MATYMAGSIREHITEEEIREAAYRKGREDQGELNTETVREIHDAVYSEAFNRAIDKCMEIVRDSSCVRECSNGFKCTECMAKRIEQLKEQSNENKHNNCKRRKSI